MTLSPGTKLGPYEILASIGAGGMGEVYRAKDTRLDRTVAIKVLPSHLSADPERKQRFEREARTISSLNHPHICTLYDIGHQDGIDYLVMEYVEGESLAQRLEKGPLTTELVLRYGIQIAEALDKAHRQSIVHRDLKPGNIMLTKSGAKLLDFGLAKLQETKTPKAAQSQMQTAGGPLTEEGVVLGTVQYMSPEQLEGKEIDSRTDIFALGTVLYEMATGKKAFTGKSQASLISAIMKDEPAPISQIQPMTPPAVDHVVKKCLSKDPDDRWQSAHDVASELKWISESGSQAGATTPLAVRKKRTGLLTTLAVFVSIIATAAAVLVSYAYLKALQKPQEVIRSSIELPANWSYDAYTGGMALSPNGRLLAFVAGNQDKSALWVRALEKTDADELAGTEGAAYPFWSPDSRFIGFFQNGKMKKIDPSGGPATVICDAPSGRGGTWNRSGLILFAPAPTGAIYQVAADGGKPSPATRQPASQGVSHRWPSFLPDSRHFLYLVNSGEQAGIFVGSLDSPETKRVASDLSNAAYVSPGYLLFVRGSTLMGQNFDPGQQVLNGEPFRITHQKISSNLTRNSSSFTVAGGGLLAYHRASIPLTQMRWYDRSGQIGSVGEPGYYSLMDIARDGNKVLVNRYDPETLDGDLWVFDAARDSASRVTFQPGRYVSAFFSFDGQRIVFSREPSFDFFVKSTTGTEAEQLLLHSDEAKVPTGWSPDGRLILYYKQTKKGSMELWLLPVTGSQRPAPFLQTPFSTTNGSFSPDGKWIAYSSNESGRDEVYVRAVTGPRQWQVSTNGGGYAQWQKDGKELYYGSPDDKIMAVEIKPGPDFAFGTPHLIFDIPQNSRGVWMAPDGQRVLLSIPVNESGSSSAPISLVVNWPAGLH
jgi:serine/threonine protein kinase/roadblock/LC7 domain-containing protein